MENNTFVISGLIAKRAELSGDIIEAEKRIARLRADLDCLDATIRLFDPKIAPKAIRPRVKRTATLPHGRTHASDAVGAAQGGSAIDRT
jgi:hypothetical protein